MTTRRIAVPRIIVRILACGAVVLAGLGVEAAHAEPEITTASPETGAVLAELPEALSLCFSEPVQTGAAEVGEGDAWRFNVDAPGAPALGLRIVFAPDGSCVDVFPGAGDSPPQGIWQFDWMVRAQADGSEGSGAILFQVGGLQPGETPLRDSDALGDDDNDVPAVLIAMVVVGIVVVAAGVGALIFRRGRA